MKGEGGNSSANKGKIRKSVIYWAVLNVGVFLLALGVHLFEAPNNFVMGGVSGLSIVIAKYTTEFGFTQPMVLAVLNVLLLVVGFIFLGKQVTFKTIICSVLYALEVYLLDLVHPLKGPMTAQPVLELLYAVTLVGAGCAIIYQCGASSGGTDILALILKKFTGVQIAYAVIVSDFLITCLAFLNGIEIGLLSLLGLFIRSFVIDGVIENITKTKSVTIITVNPEIAAKYIIEDMDRSFTSYEGKGGYTGEPRTILIAVCNRTQAMRLKLKLHQSDPTAFVIISDVNEILGEGFAERM